jgi:hypothetical protein
MGTSEHSCDSLVRFSRVEPENWGLVALLLTAQQGAISESSNES